MQEYMSTVKAGSATCKNVVHYAVQNKFENKPSIFVEHIVMRLLYMLSRVFRCIS